jgi:hypothetical protein
LSFLTKLLALLVSLLSIFLCGAVVVFVTNTNNWKKAYQGQETITRAAQTYALQREMDLNDQQQIYESQLQQLNQLIVSWQNEYAKLENDLKQEASVRITSESKADSAVKVSEALAALVDSMRRTRDVLQQRLEVAHNDKRKAETQVTKLNEDLNQEKVKVAQLDSIRRRNEEKIRALENDIALLEQKYQRAMLASSDPRILPDQVTVRAPQPGRIPIRGEITDILGDRAAISVGSSSGVRENMEFNVFRGSEFLGSLVVLQVESTQSAGRLQRTQGTIVKGDKVSTGFD